MQTVGKIYAVNQSNGLRAQFRITWDGNTGPNDGDGHVGPRSRVEIPIPSDVPKGATLVSLADVEGGRTYSGTPAVTFDPDSSEIATYSLSGPWLSAKFELIGAVEGKEIADAVGVVRVK